MRKLILGIVFIGALVGAFFFTRSYHPSSLANRHLSYNCSETAFLKERLNLSSSQEKVISNLEGSFAKKSKLYCDQLNQKRAKLGRLLFQPSPNKREIDLTIEEIATLQTQLEKKVIDHILEVKGVLDLKQQKEFLSFIFEELCERNNIKDDSLQKALVK